MIFPPRGVEDGKSPVEERWLALPSLQLSNLFHKRVTLPQRVLKIEQPNEAISSKLLPR